MIIDFHTHVHPPKDAAEPLWQGRSPMTIENVLKAQEIGGVDVSFISNPLHHLARMDRDQQYQAADRSNNYLASLQDKHASIFAFAVAVPWGGDRFLKQFEAAEANLLEARTIFVKTRGEQHQDTRKCTQGIVDLYTAWHAAQPGKGYDTKAAEWKAKLPKDTDPPPQEKK